MRARGAGAVVRDRLTKDRGIDQRLPPDRQADQRPLLEQGEDILVCNHGNLRLADSANRVIHFFDKERLRVRQIPRDVERQVLALTVRKGVISRDDALEHEGRRLRLISFSNKVLVRLQPPHACAHRPRSRLVQRLQSRMLLKCSQENVLSARHAVDRAENVPAITTHRCCPACIKRQSASFTGLSCPICLWTHPATRGAIG